MLNLGWSILIVQEYTIKIIILSLVSLWNIRCHYGNPYNI